jgi:hypothetical protein
VRLLIILKKLYYARLGGRSSSGDLAAHVNYLYVKRIHLVNFVSIVIVDTFQWTNVTSDEVIS